MSNKDSGILAKLRQSIASIDLQAAREAAAQAMSSGIPLQKILTEGVSNGADIVGQKYEEGEFFLAELVMCGEILKEITMVLSPLLARETKTSISTVVIGTVKGDLHDIGKNIVASLLRAAQFTVVDLGVDVSVEKYIEAVKQHKAKILGMSALLTVTMPQIEEVNKALIDAGIRHGVKVIVGGAALTEDYALKVGADAYAENAAVGIRKCKEWAEAGYRK